jgi:histidine kinase/DNA gyrase B/HSP90-like ATPase
VSDSPNENLVSLGCFIEAIRDAGYRGPSAALAELIDNALEASASRVDISLSCDSHGAPLVRVQDDGIGMTPSVLRLALQFGGTTRFDSRRGIGRYGMGLPAGSLSQAQRVDVYSWVKPCEVWWTYLDVGEVRSGKLTTIPAPVRRMPSQNLATPSGPNGTIVLWSKCDRLAAHLAKSLETSLRSEIGRIFRTHLWRGKVLTLNGFKIQPVDPLFSRPGKNIQGAVPYGPPLRFHVEIADSRRTKRCSEITAQFVELPIRKWHCFSNDEKRAEGISKSPGVSILRAGREIDLGWFFMGSKRKENYDDWWRCEVRFEPELDEFFGVNHIKQGIHPTETLVRILAPDFERVAHELNGRVRRTFLCLKRGETLNRAVEKAEARDALLEPPPHDLTGHQQRRVMRWWRGRPRLVAGFSYRIKVARLTEACFFEPTITRNRIQLVLNEQHPFYERIYRNGRAASTIEVEAFELLLLAAGRAEARLRLRDERRTLQRFREHWSDALVAFLA